MTRALVLALVLCAPAFGYTVAPIPPSQHPPNAPAAKGATHFSHLYRITVTKAETVVQHVVGIITVYCLDSGQAVQIAQSTTDYWEYWAFTQAGSSIDQHAAEGNQAINLMLAAAQAQGVTINCQCYRVDVSMTFTVYEGTAQPNAGGNPPQGFPDSSNPAGGNVGTFGIPAAPQGQQSSSTWTFPNGPPGTTPANAFGNAPNHTVTFDKATARTVTHQASWEVGDCPPPPYVQPPPPEEVLPPTTTTTPPSPEEEDTPVLTTPWFAAMFLVLVCLAARRRSTASARTS